ncbi:MAG: hypothetical protein COV29_03815 [Candidatus Yanofskybacteria bacterium CG10_big_fil_rev_8_21_14_0_10_36_16]|uniref:Uncharacterized protein n=1 Tax=Candidatus Yanofskybacteria bacterium CG10_big_fil_rev_8_21_14_0_10_36_16 TaxID=1975096 RepID=A0A2J0Q6L9_9BACT|nr:MAG: hypothetical protein COV29_03815 [Candidatus Yanofskybacteria bacterium CG10_big_fil_rev_8_21_14_0_10_36_16]
MKFKIAKIFSYDNFPFSRAGFTILETLIAAALFVIIGGGIYLAYSNILEIITRGRLDAEAAFILEKEIEIVRNMSYENIGTTTGAPFGKLKSEKTVIAGNIPFVLRTTVRNIDHIFDGKLKGKNNIANLDVGAQVGEGGLRMENQSKIIGDVFSNGDIIGTGNSNITGSAWAAGSSKIDTVNVANDVHANTILNSFVGRDAYYKNISNTTVVGNLFSNVPDIEPQELPISPQQLAEWKTLAAEGGTIPTQTISGSNIVPLGPIKINGNLTIRNSGRLIITGVIWVTGDILMQNDAVIEIDPSFGMLSGLIITDGSVMIRNESAICGSEGYNTSTQTCNPPDSSFVFIVSTKETLEDPAITINNASDLRTLVHANNGTINLKNAIQLVNATGYSILLENTASVIYDEDLDDVEFGFGSLASVQEDLAPGDYKLVEIEISCPECTLPFTPKKVTATVAPQGLETVSRNGSLFINAIDASGDSTANATVHVVNNSANPPIDITDVTGSDGKLQIIDVATGSFTYEIIVSKAGYSTEQTYLPGEPSNPNPVKPHATVAEQDVTEITFVIDRTSTMNLTTSDYICSPVADINFLQEGSKLIGQSPDVLKYSENLSTDTNGNYTNNSLEWDTYNLSLTDSGFDLAGTDILMPLVINPNTNRNITWTVKPKFSNSLLAVARDTNGNFVNDAEVTVSGPETKSAFTGLASISYTDWSGGNYDSQSGGIATTPAGQLTLVDLGGNKYASNSEEWLISNTIDFGTSTIFYGKIDWDPKNQPAQTGANSLKFQIAANNDNNTWNFVGPDGSSNTYYTTAKTDIYSQHDGNRYLRYKAYLQTVDQGFTPLLDKIIIEFNSSCVPEGQALLNNLPNGSYNITIDHPGYKTYNDNININSEWQEYRAILVP